MVLWLDKRYKPSPAGVLATDGIPVLLDALAVNLLNCILLTIVLLSPFAWKCRFGCYIR